ncbi:YceI family protein [Kitasatospora mediocidica]|uniref:YceI family protein n=1 Tax=Kitasatospora mediocidica TaxID=58352 RepID=UPI000568A27F|nr:YceI family protein [Kitasatospora mediocidica]
MSALLQLPGLTPGVWALDPVHSTVGFMVRHMMVSKVRGTFDTFSGQITVAEDALLSSVRAEIDMTSINTRNAGRDDDLRSHNFFETDKYPTMTYTSASVSGSGDDYTVAGELTLKGVSRPVELALEFHGVRSAPGMGTRAGFSATGEISRKEFGVSFDMPMAEGGVVVGDRIRIELDIEAILQE